MTHLIRFTSRLTDTVIDVPCTLEPDEVTAVTSATEDGATTVTVRLVKLADDRRVWVLATLLRGAP